MPPAERRGVRPAAPPLSRLVEHRDPRPGTAAEAVRAATLPPREAARDAADERLVAQMKRAVAALLDKKAEKLVVLHLGGLTAVSDYFVLASGTSDRQAQALADAVEMAMKAEGRRPLSVEGYRTATWILLDYGDAVFHIFHDEARRFYGLERLWGDAPDATARFS
jgi:ribosome-associated protein